MKIRSQQVNDEIDLQKDAVAYTLRPVLVRKILFHILLLIVYVVTIGTVNSGCGDDVVNGDELVNGPSLAGKWILDCDSASDGTMVIEMVDGSITGSAWIVDSINYCWGVYSDDHDDFGQLKFQHSNERLHFVLEGRVFPSKELIRGEVSLGYRQESDWEIVLHDSVTAIKQ